MTTGRINQIASRASCQPHEHCPSMQRTRGYVPIELTQLCILLASRRARPPLALKHLLSEHTCVCPSRRCPQSDSQTNSADSQQRSADAAANYTCRHDTIEDLSSTCTRWHCKLSQLSTGEPRRCELTACQRTHMFSHVTHMRHCSPRIDVHRVDTARSVERAVSSPPEVNHLNTHHRHASSAPTIRSSGDTRGRWEHVRHCSTRTSLHLHMSCRRRDDWCSSQPLCVHCSAAGELQSIVHWRVTMRSRRPTSWWAQDTDVMSPKT